MLKGFYYRLQGKEKHIQLTEEHLSLQVLDPDILLEGDTTYYNLRIIPQLYDNLKFIHVNRLQCYYLHQDMEVACSLIQV